jgi:hypothetical protein
MAGTAHPGEVLRIALEIAELLELRPLAARYHLGLGQVHRRTKNRHQLERWPRGE